MNILGRADDDQQHRNDGRHHGQGNIQDCHQPQRPYHAQACRQERDNHSTERPQGKSEGSEQHQNRQRQHPALVKVDFFQDLCAHVGGADLEGDIQLSTERLKETIDTAGYPGIVVRLTIVGAEIDIDCQCSTRIGKQIGGDERIV